MNAHSVAAPKAGRSLEGIIAPLRERVTAAATVATRSLSQPFAWLAEASSNDLIAEHDWLSRSGWAVVAITLVEAIATDLTPDAKRALTWFGARPEGMHLGEIDAALAPLSGRSDLGDLLPYLLDTFGRTSRLDVMRDDQLRSARNARKQRGSFYTPADVVAFMVGAIAPPPSSSDGAKEHWLDPACGSGVFLAGALRLRAFRDEQVKLDFASKRLHGCDISPQACDFAAFTILSLVARAKEPPLESWRAIRTNMVALDATQQSFGTAGAGLRDVLGLDAEPLRLICNPPYTSAGHGATLADGYPTRALYLPFVEMAWRIADGPNDAASLVVPLALGANRSADHRRCRTAMAQAGGSWTLLFFDRQPHALFGEEAKTRATIAIRRPGPKPSEIRTSGLLKWTSRQRVSIFSEERATSMGQARIARLVPKLDSCAGTKLYRALEEFRLRNGRRPDPVKASARDIVGSMLTADVFVAGTAYNFLNVFRNYPDHLSWRGTLSASGIHRLRCGDQEEADAVTAILVSRFAYWLWHVECDGFHVPAWFLAELPLLNIRRDSHATAKLAELGRRAWAGLQRDIHCSVNRERLTFAFRPTDIGPLRTDIDRLLLALIGANPDNAELLEEFERRVVSIDGSVRLAQKRINPEKTNEAVR